MAIKEVRKVAPLVAYFIKNGGLNSVTSAATAGFLPAIVEIMTNPAFDQGIGQLSAGSQGGAIAATILIALRAALGFWRSIKK
jgi:hypothetical protein